MHTLLFLLAAHAAGAPDCVEVPCSPRAPLCYRVSDWLQHCGMVISGTAHTYNRPGIPVSPGPTPAYRRYFGEAPHPLLTAPMPTSSAAVNSPVKNDKPTPPSPSNNAPKNDKKEDNSKSK